MTSAGDDAIDLAESAGLFLDPWQQFVLTEALGERADGKWAAFEVALVMPRQNGKGSVLEALELAGLFLFGEGGPPPLILHSAHEFKTSAEHFRRMRDLIEGADHLRKRVRIVRTAAGSESIELESGARLRFVTRTGGSGRGFSADTIVIDEAYNLTAEAMAAVLPTMSARPNPQVWYTSSAGMLASEQLARIRARGMAGGDPRLAYLEWSASDGADLDDRDEWARANPAMGIRIPEEFIEAERLALPDEQFARERLGVWPEPPGRELVEFAARWRGCFDPGTKPGPTIRVAVDLPPDQSSAVISVGSLRKDTRKHVEVVAHRPGTGWAVDEALRLCQRWNAGVPILDGTGPAKALIPDFAERGVEPQVMSGAEVAQACGAFFADVLEGRIAHDVDTELDAAVDGATRRQIGDGAWAWSRRNSTVNISPLVSVTLAAWGAGTAKSSGFNIW